MACVDFAALASRFAATNCSSLAISTFRLNILRFTSFVHIHVSTHTLTVTETNTFLRRNAANSSYELYDPKINPVVSCLAVRHAYLEFCHHPFSLLTAIPISSATPSNIPDFNAVLTPSSNSAFAGNSRRRQALMTLLDVLGELTTDENRYAVGVCFRSVSCQLSKEKGFRRHPRPPNGLRG